MNPRGVAATLGCLVLVLAFCAAQAQETAFQIVSVRKAQSLNPALVIVTGETPSMTALPGGRFEARRQSLEELVRLAYGFDDEDARRGVVDSNAVYWASTDRFDITATAERSWSMPPAGTSTPAELRPMLRMLLEDRFQLLTRVETKKVDVYALRRSSRNGEPGPWLRPAAGGCLGPYTPRSRTPGDTTPRCTFILETNIVEAGGVTMGDLIRILTRVSGSQLSSRNRPIVDDTGFKGTFDILLAIGLGKRSTLPKERAEVDKRVAEAARASFIQYRSQAVLDALEQQLGLKVEMAKMSIPTLVLLRAKQPRED
jgi:uncharacterized protein (TIGR03435 family)